MTPLEAAKRLLDNPPMWEGSNGNPCCAVCHALTYILTDLSDPNPVYTEPEHTPECPIPSLPKIVAALEIVKALAEQGPRLEILGAGLSRCQDCAMEGLARDLDEPEYHAFDCPWRQAKELSA